jgi:hypothetical protein
MEVFTYFPGCQLQKLDFLVGKILAVYYFGLHHFLNVQGKLLVSFRIE